MPRNPSAPPAPDSPATWLANFRYRLAGAHRQHLSPEALGFQMGVSGATVRRWEAGLAHPSEDDLHRFADVCRLSPHQREFMRRLYSRGQVSTPEPPSSSFRQAASNVLSGARPAALVDELFFIRAWNSYFAELTPNVTPRLPAGVNAILLAVEAAERGDGAVGAERIRSVVRMMWMWTAHLASLPAYQTLVRELIEHEVFAESWQEIVEEFGDGPGLPLRLPNVGSDGESSSFNLYTTEVIIPPLYRVFVYEPCTLASRDALQAQLDAGPAEVFFADRLYWPE